MAQGRHTGGPVTGRRPEAGDRTERLTRVPSDGRPAPGGARRSSPEELAASATTSRIPTAPRPRVGKAVFVDGSGRRARRFQLLVVLVAALGALFVTVVAASALSGPTGPVGPAGPVGGVPGSRTPAPTVGTGSNAIVEIPPSPTATTTRGAAPGAGR